MILHGYIQFGRSKQHKYRLREEGYKLVGEKEDCFEREFTTAKVEKVFEGRTK